MAKHDCQWPECWQFCGEPCEPDYEPLGFPDRPVYPVKPATFDTERVTPWQKLRDAFAFARWIAGGLK